MPEDKAIKWLENHVDEAAKGLDLAVQDKLKQLREKFKRLHEGKEVTISGEEYIEASKLGLTCSIVGCLNKPTWKCPRCGHHYCEEHKFLHICH